MCAKPPGLKNPWFSSLFFRRNSGNNGHFLALQGKIVLFCRMPSVKLDVRERWFITEYEIQNTLYELARQCNGKRRPLARLALQRNLPAEQVRELLDDVES